MALIQNGKNRKGVIPQVIYTRLLDPNLFFSRCGIIFYRRNENRIDFILACDAFHGELTDLGGISIGNEKFIETAVREAKEESLGYFNFSEKDVYENSIAVYDENMIILFQEVEIPNVYEMFINYRKYFLEELIRGTSREKLENSFLIWISTIDLYGILNHDSRSFSIETPYYNTSDISLPLGIGKIISGEYHRFISTYPRMYSPVRNFLQPIFSTLCSLLRL